VRDVASFGIKRTLDVGFDDALARIPGALKAEGFGVLTEIDVQQTLKSKLGVGFRRYRILGACNPPFAHKALEHSLDIGLLLPCNVIVYEATTAARWSPPSTRCRRWPRRGTKPSDPSPKRCSGGSERSWTGFDRRRPTAVTLTGAAASSRVARLDRFQMTPLGTSERLDQLCGVAYRWWAVFHHYGHP
jgi:uncharacterized protein (DUF302 family)